MKILIGIDIGTTKICVAAFDADTGMVTAVKSAANNTAISGESDASEQDACRIVDLVIRLMAEITALISDCSKIVGIGVTGQMHGALLCGPDGNPLTSLITWQDQRGSRLYEKTGCTYTDEVRRRIGDQALARTGTAPSTGYGAVTLFRLACTSCISSDVKALTIHDYLVRCLTGVSATDPTDAASWGVFDVQNGQSWLPDIEKCLDLPAGLLPQIYETGSVAGHLLPEIALKTGLPAGTPVSVGLGDNQASFLGSVPSISDSVLFNIGTGGQMSISSDKYTYNAGLDTRPLVSGKWLRVGASLCGGSAFKILASFFSQVGSDIFRENVLPESLYNKMVEIAESVEDNEIPDFAPYFCGTRIDSTRRAQITNINILNFTPAHLSRAIINGMVDELVSYYEIVRSNSPVPEYIAGSGNGFRRNSLLRQRFASYFGSQILLPPNEEEAAVGAALAAGVGCGVFADWNEAGHRLYADVISEN